MVQAVTGGTVQCAVVARLPLSGTAPGPDWKRELTLLNQLTEPFARRIGEPGNEDHIDKLIAE